MGVIEHTNFEPPQTYGGRHLVYLSKYLSESDSLYGMSREAALEYTLPHLQRMFRRLPENGFRECTSGERSIRNQSSKGITVV